MIIQRGKNQTRGGASPIAPGSPDERNDESQEPSFLVKKMMVPGKILLTARFVMGLFFAFFSTAVAQIANLSVHGYLNQAFAVSFERQYLGIPVDGTWDYRNLALQFRYDLQNNKTFIIQFSHQQLGVSPIMSVTNDIDLDWAFFEYRFTDATSLKLGRIQLPFGIFNEIRDVGTLLPFYDVPVSFYGGERFVSETVDGAVFSHSNANLFPGTLEINLYGGHWSFLEWYRFVNPLTGKSQVRIGFPRVENVLGTQVWFYTPLEGVRFGGGGFRGHMEGGISFTEDGLLGKRDIFTFAFSGEAKKDAGYIRSEFARYSFQDLDVKITAYYVNGGVNPLSNLSVNFQAEFLDLNNLNSLPPFQNNDKNYQIAREYILGVNYAFNYALVLKTEMHWNYSYNINAGFTSMLNADPLPTHFFITNLAVSF